MYKIISKSGKVCVCSCWTTVYVRKKDGSNSIELRYLINDQDKVYHSMDLNDLDKIEEVK